jgi:hypothetical protein
MDIESINKRNARVEADKAWETSWTRCIAIAFATYLIMTLYMAWLGIDRYYLHGLIPAIGYFFSTLSLPVLKKYWIANIYKRSEHGHPVS